jgi:hypothetical protein
MISPPAIVNTIGRQMSLVPAGTAENPSQFVEFREGVIRLLNSRLEVISVREVEAARVLAARGIEHLVLCDDADLRIIAEQDVTIAHLSCDAAAFVDGFVIATAPAEDSHRVLLIAPDTGEILDEFIVDAWDATAFITPHPSEPVVTIEVPMGQDGCVVQRVQIDGGSLQAEEILRGEDPVIAGFDPSGSRLLVTPYPDDPESARVLSWPSLDEIGRLSAADLGTDLGIGIAACWIDEARIALYAMEDALVLADGHLGNPERLSFPVEFGDNGDLESLTLLEPGRIAAGVWIAGDRSTSVLEF